MSFSDRWPITHRDPGLALFGEALGASGLDIPPHSTVFEIGCAEADWKGPALAAEPTLTYVGLDWRSHKDAPDSARDVLQIEMAPGSFDWIVAISTIEHVGLGRYGDPTDPDGDIKVMRRVAEWLKPGGLVYFDVPYTPEGYYVEGGNKCRCYDEATLAARLFAPPLTCQWIGYANAHGYPLIDKPAKNPPAHNGRPFWYVACWLVKGPFSAVARRTALIEEFDREVTRLDEACQPDVPLLVAMRQQTRTMKAMIRMCQGVDGRIDATHTARSV